MVDALARDRALQLRLGRRESHRSDGPDRADDRPARRIGPGSSRLALRRRSAGGWLLAEEIVRVAQVYRLAVEPGLGKSDVDAGIAAELAWKRAGRVLPPRAGYFPALVLRRGPADGLRSGMKTTIRRVQVPRASARSCL